MTADKQTIGGLHGYSMEFEYETEVEDDITVDFGRGWDGILMAKPSRWHTIRLHVKTPDNGTFALRVRYNDEEQPDEDGAWVFQFTGMDPQKPLGQRHALEALIEAAQRDWARQHGPSDEPKGERVELTGDDIPEHLRPDAPYVDCPECGRRTWSEFGQRCNMPQPNGTRCDGEMGSKPDWPVVVRMSITEAEQVQDYVRDGGPECRDVAARIRETLGQ